MKGFIFSRRFFIPFLVMLAGHVAWFSQKLYRLYDPDFVGKGFPSGVRWKWIWYNVTGSVFIFGFLAAFVTGSTFYSYYKCRKDKQGFKPFSVINCIIILLIAALGFVNTSFVTPHQHSKSLKILSNAVYARNYEEFQNLMKDTASFIKNEMGMTLPELNWRRQTLKAGGIVENNIMFPGLQNKSLMKINLAIAEKYSLPLIVVLFYITGVFTGLSFHKVHVIVPMLISYFVVFAAWFYCNNLFAYWYKYKKAGLLIGGFGTVFLFLVILTGWYLGLRKYNAFKTTGKAASIDFDEEKLVPDGEKM